MSETATISTEFQISIPKAVRDERGWLPGQELAFVPRNGGVMLVPVPELDDLMGILSNTISKIIATEPAAFYARQRAFFSIRPRS